MQYERLRNLSNLLLPVLLAGAAGCGASANQQTSGAGGSTATGGSSGNLDSGSADSFVLSWQDDFDTLDATAWQLQTFTFGGNEAQFTPQNATVANGILTISLTPNPSSTTEPYWGVEMRSAKTLTYGKV